MHVGERICALQKREKVRQNVLARMVGITPGALTNFEKGRRQVSLDWLERIADALDTPSPTSWGRDEAAVCSTTSGWPAVRRESRSYGFTT